MFMLRSATYLLKIHSSDLKSAYNSVAYSIKHTETKMQMSQTAKVILKVLLIPWGIILKSTKLFWKSKFCDSFALTDKCIKIDVSRCSVSASIHGTVS